MPPTLTRRLLLIRLTKALPQFPRELLQAGQEAIISLLTEALANGRPIVLRGFGRLHLRRYRNSRKKAGIIFRPSPAFLQRLNPPD